MNELYALGNAVLAAIEDSPDPAASAAGVLGALDDLRDRPPAR